MGQGDGKAKTMGTGKGKRIEQEVVGVKRVREGEKGKGKRCTAWECDRNVRVGDEWSGACVGRI